MSVAVMCDELFLGAGVGSRGSGWHTDGLSIDEPVDVTVGADDECAM